MPTDGTVLNIHDILPRSRANGPGVRLVIWFQGCTLGCPGCFNPETHSSDARRLMSVEELLGEIAASEPEIEGLTISGGEPLQQPDGLWRLLTGVRERTRLSVLLFSGYRQDEIRRMPCGPQVLDQVDVLIAGRYDHRRRLAAGLRGSSNQAIHLLTDRYTLDQIEATPAGEVLIHPTGDLSISGICPPNSFGAAGRRR